MAKGTRRSPAQLIAEYEARIAALKAQTGLTSSSPSVVKVINAVKKIATDNGIEHKAVIKLVSDALVPKTTPVKKT